MLSSCQGGPIGFFNKMGDRFERISSKKDKAVEAEPKGEESPATENDSKQNRRPEQTIVYGNAYDAFVNVRSEPSYNAKVIGKLHNGPEGAVLLGDYGEWMKIELDGRIGYVTSKYISYEPTVAYTGSVSGDWIVGGWNCSGTGLFVYDNGTWELGYDYTYEYGTYIMQNNEVKFTLLWELEEAEKEVVYYTDGPSFFLSIDKSSDKLGDYQRSDFIEESDDDEDMSYDYCTVSKEKFAWQKKELYKKVSKILKKR